MKKKEEVFHVLVVFVFLIYLFFLSYLLFFSAAYGRTENLGYRYNLVPFREIRRCFQNFQQVGFFYVMINIGGNIVAFMPFGWLLPVLYKKKINAGTVFLKTLLLSLTAECIQLYTKTGAFDVDDLLLNVLGGLLGFLFFQLFFGKKQKKRKG